MSDEASNIDDDQTFPHVLGEITLSTGPHDLFTFGINGLDALTIWHKVKTWVNDSVALGSRIVIQYSPASNGFEAGSRWFDANKQIRGNPWHDVQAADTVLGYIFDLETGFSAGKEFVV